MTKKTKLRSTAWAPITAVLVALVVLSPAAGAEERSSGGLPDVAYATAQVKKYTAVPKFTPLEGAVPFDASKLRGKRVFYVGIGTQFQLQKVMIPIFKSLLSSYGISMTVFENQGTPAEWAKGVQQAVAQKYDLILTQGNNARFFAPAIKLANQAGIPLVAGFDQVKANGPPKGIKVAGQTYTSVQLTGQLQADWVISDSKGKADALVVTSNDILIAPPQVAAIRQEFAKRCGSGCKVTVVNVPLNDWAQKMQGAVQSALIANPNIKYVLPLYTAMQQFVVPAIQAVNGAGKIKSAAYNGTPFGLDMIRTGNIVAMDAGEDLTCIDAMQVDNVMRVLSGLKTVENVDPRTGWAITPVRVWTKSNVREAGVPAAYLKGYGGSCLNAYKRIWSGK